MNPERQQLRDRTLSDTKITDPVNHRHNPAERGLQTRSPVKWPAELLTPKERARDTKIFLFYFSLFAIAAQLAAGTMPLLAGYRAQTMMAALFLLINWLVRIPLLFRCCIAISPFCLLAPYHTEFLALRAIVCFVMPIYTAYYFRHHLIGLVTSSPLSSTDADEYRIHGTLPDAAILPPLISGSWNGFVLGLQSWFTYLGNEQRLPTVYNSPAGVWHSRTFATALGVFGMVIILPHELIFICTFSLLVLIHPVVALLAIPLAALAPILAMGALMFLFCADQLRSAWALSQYATLPNTFSEFVYDIAPGEHSND